MNMLIDGKDTPSLDDTWTEVINPVTGEVLDRVPCGSAPDVDAAVESAQGAFDSWSKKTTRERGMVLCRAAELIRQQHTDLARFSPENRANPSGSPLMRSGDAQISLSIMPPLPVSPQVKQSILAARGTAWSCGNLWASVVRSFPGTCPRSLWAGKSARHYSREIPLSSNRASATPLTNLKIAGCLRDAGLPPGILNVVTGPGETVGGAIVKHPLVKKISFTGGLRDRLPDKGNGGAPVQGHHP